MHKGYIIIGDVHNESHLLGHAIDYACSMNQNGICWRSVDYGPFQKQSHGIQFDEQS